jgi:hypothetical protein
MWTKQGDVHPCGRRLATKPKALDLSTDTTCKGAKRFLRLIKFKKSVFNDGVTYRSLGDV